MGNQYSFQSLRDSGKGLDDVAEQVRTEWEQLRAESQDFEGLFGDGQDDVGGLLRTLYEVVHGMADESFTSAAKNFQGLGKLLVKAGDRHEETEDINAEILGRLKSAAEGVENGSS